MVTIPSHTNMQFLIAEYIDFLTPLKQTEYTEEYEHILNTAVVNGFYKPLQHSEDWNTLKKQPHYLL